MAAKRSTLLYRCESPPRPRTNTFDRRPTMPCFYLTPKQDDFNQLPELQVCIAEALYDVDSMWRFLNLLIR